MIILLNLLINFIKNIFFFTGSYSNTVFKDPLPSDEEEKYIWINTGDQEKQEYLILYMDRGAVTYGNDLFGENYEKI